MTIEQLVVMAERIHDAEGWHLGSKSTRDTRNAFWARVVGCAYWGHPVYNAQPDRQWHLKRADATRPQTDDVATSLPSRNHWDCIPGAGADGYRFAATPHGVLPAEQIVYAPPVPNGGGVPLPPPVTKPEPVPGFPYPDEGSAIKAFQSRIRKAYNDAGRIFPDPQDSDAFRWFSRYGYDCHTKPEPEVADKQVADLRKALGVGPEIKST